MKSDAAPPEATSLVLSQLGSLVFRQTTALSSQVLFSEWDRAQAGKKQTQRRD